MTVIDVGSKYRQMSRLSDQTMELVEKQLFGRKPSAEAPPGERAYYHQCQLRWDAAIEPTRIRAAAEQVEYARLYATNSTTIGYNTHYLLSRRASYARNNREVINALINAFNLPFPQEVEGVAVTHQDEMSTLPQIRAILL
jgi:hypothetical protein